MSQTWDDVLSENIVIVGVGEEDAATDFEEAPHDARPCSARNTKSEVREAARGRGEGSSAPLAKHSSKASTKVSTSAESVKTSSQPISESPPASLSSDCSSPGELADKGKSASKSDNCCRKTQDSSQTATPAAAKDATGDAQRACINAQRGRGGNRPFSKRKTPTIASANASAGTAGGT
jgi:hypothetical protein